MLGSVRVCMLFIAALLPLLVATAMSFTATKIGNVTVDDGIRLFYREAGSRDAPVVLLLHGFPSSSFQYRNLITKLAPHYHVIVRSSRP